MRFVFFPFLLLIALASGCATVGSLDTLERAQGVVDLVTLDREFKEARAALLENDFTPAERAAVMTHLRRLQKVKNGVSELESVASAVVSPEAARAFLDDVAESFNGIKAIYGGYLQRVQEPPSDVLVNYSNAGVRIWRMLRAAAERDVAIPAKNIQGLVVYLARGYLLYRTGVGPATSI